MTEYIEEKTPDGFGVVRRRATRWKNESQNTIRVRIIDAEAVPAKFEGGPFVPQKILKLDIKPGESVLIPAEHDEAIQQTRCRDTDCDRGRACKDASHSRQVFGGLAPGLVRIGDEPRGPVTIHPAAMSVPRAAPIEDLDARLLRRAAKGATP